MVFICERAAWCMGLNELCELLGVQNHQTNEKNDERGVLLSSSLTLARMDAKAALKSARAAIAAEKYDEAVRVCSVSV